MRSQQHAADTIRICGRLTRGFLGLLRFTNFRFEGCHLLDLVGCDATTLADVCPYPFAPFLSGWDAQAIFLEVDVVVMTPHRTHESKPPANPARFESEPSLRLSQRLVLFEFGALQYIPPMQHVEVPFFPPANSRTHEVCGAGIYLFAFALAARLTGHTMWVREDWETTQINPTGFADFVEPSELTVCRTSNQIETLAVAEEALRSGVVPLVVLSVNKPLGLTEGRRLQLAARDGKSTGLAIIPESMGSNAAETRWRCTPVFDAQQNQHASTLQKWELKKNKSGTLGAWYVRWDRTSRRLTVVSPARE